MISASIIDNPNKIILCEIHWPSGPIYIHNRIGQKRWDNKTWLGVGSLAKISKKEEGTKTGRRTLTLTVTDDTLLSEAAKDDAVGREVFLYVGGLDEKQRITEAELFDFQLIVDVPIKAGETSSISLQLGGVRERFKHAQESLRLSANSWRAKYPGDSYCDDIEAIAKGPLSSYSGSQSVGTIRTGGGGTGGVYLP